MSLPTSPKANANGCVLDSELNLRKAAAAAAAGIAARTAESLPDSSVDVRALIDGVQALHVTPPVPQPGFVASLPLKSGEYATLQLGLAHFISEAKNLRLKDEMFSSPEHLLAPALLRMVRFFRGAESQVGSANVKSFTVAFFDTALSNTPFEWLALSGQSWQEIIADIRGFFELPEEDATRFFADCLAIHPTDKLTIKQCLLKIIDIFYKAKYEHALSVLPPAPVLCRTILSWFPPTSRASIPAALISVTTSSTWEDIIPSILTLATSTPATLRGHKAHADSKAKVVSEAKASNKAAHVSASSGAPHKKNDRQSASSFVPSSGTPTSPPPPPPPAAAAAVETSGRLRHKQVLSQ